MTYVMGERRGRVTPEWAAAVARAAYVWAWPMINVGNRVRLFEKLPESGLMSGIVPGAPPNRAQMLTGYIAAGETMVACPNQDVAYGVGPLVPGLEPVVIQVPDFGDRFWVYQVVDQRTDAFLDLGAMYGTKPGAYLVVPSGWEGEVPAGIAAVQELDTRVGICIPRVFFKDTDQDRAAVQEVLSHISVYPLSEYDGTEKVTDWSTPRTFPAPPSQAGREAQWVVPQTFVADLAAVIADVPARPGEEALYDQIRDLLTACETHPTIAETVAGEAAAADAELVDRLFEFRNYGIPLDHHWTTVDDNAAFGTDYLTRAAVAKSNIFTNRLAETRYYYLDLDADGQRLNGTNTYALTFPGDALPPVRGFWSLTVYNDRHFFQVNPLDRYSIGTKTPTLEHNPDGSLTITVAVQQARGNWIPAPEGNFTLYLRLYWPDTAATTGTWTPPAVLRT